MSRKRKNKKALKVLLGVILGIGLTFIAYLVVVIFGNLLPEADPNLANIQGYIDWSRDAFAFLVTNVVGFTFFGALLGGAGVVTYLALKQA